LIPPEIPEPKIIPPATNEIGPPAIRRAAPPTAYPTPSINPVKLAIFLLNELLIYLFICLFFLIIINFFHMPTTSL